MALFIASETDFLGRVLILAGLAYFSTLHLSEIYGIEWLDCVVKDINVARYELVKVKGEILGFEDKGGFRLPSLSNEWWHCDVVLKFDKKNIYWFEIKIRQSLEIWNLTAIHATEVK